MKLFKIGRVKAVIYILICLLFLTVYTLQLITHTESFAPFSILVIVLSMGTLGLLIYHLTRKEKTNESQN